jgi:hypothetical protein
MYPSITNIHENEIFNYLYKTKKGLTIQKHIFFELIERKAGNMFFDSSKPLNLENSVSKSNVTREGDEKIKEAEREIENLRKEREQKTKNLYAARRDGNTVAAKKIESDIKGIDTATMKALAAIDHLRNGLKEVQKAAAFDLFSQVENRIELKYAVNSLFGTKNIEIWGLSKPSMQLRQKLQKNGFKWSEWNKVWVKKNYNSDDLSFAKSIAEKSENKKSKLAK